MNYRLVALVLLVLTGCAVDAPKPFGPVPTERQLRWHELQFYGFIHFTVNTFTDKEWGYGDESPSIFDPTDFDAPQIARTAREAGMRGLILTCKHHDGFCLWPSEFTEHSVKNSPWRDGQGDMVREIADACREEGLLFGVYLSPWDRNHPEYGTPAYIAYYRNQLQELLTNYGPIFEVWFDGANGGDGYYGGARETRRIDNRTYYDWENTWSIVRELQPMACMFSDGGPDVRWVGNEKGFAGDPCWATMNREGLLPGVADPQELNVGHRGGSHWLPAEVDVSIRPGWFYHPNEDAAVKTPEQLVDIYYKSVGRGANLLLNLPPDRRGRIHELDVAALRGMRQILDSTFERNLALEAKISASNTRGKDERFSPRMLLDGESNTYWCTDDDLTNPEVVLQWNEQVTFDVVTVSENVQLGQRVEEIAIDAWTGDSWQEVATATSIGAQRLLRFPTVTTTGLRLRVTKSPVCPALAELGVFKQPL
jgi:alpha-L-fucosidase